VDDDNNDDDDDDEKRTSKCRQRSIKSSISSVSDTVNGSEGRSPYFATVL
jgi:hypothetical protein